jgi:hypothetical protein
MNTYVNFETAKLLKEKGFDEPCPNLYYEPERCKKPTISDVVMWLYEKHGFWIYVKKRKNTEENKPFVSFIGEIRVTTRFSTPSEAYEAAILYSLKNLI